MGKLAVLHPYSELPARLAGLGEEEFGAADAPPLADQRAGGRPAEPLLNGLGYPPLVVYFLEYPIHRRFGRFPNHPLILLG
jgi:hypothetical protein